MVFKRPINFPTILTLSRLILSILLLPILLVGFLPYNLFWLNCILAALFFILGLTDFFDGYLARKYKQETKIGKALDHIADKFLITSTLISLLAIQKIYFFWVIILISRELFVLGLREIALENNLSIPVSFYGKLKTALQMIMLFVIILNPQASILFTTLTWSVLENILIVFTLFLSIYSAIQYYKSIFRS